MSEAEADWSNLNRDMLEKIGKKIEDYSDYVSFSAVCVGWRSLLLDNPPKHFQDRFPYLLVPHHTPLTENTLTPRIPCVPNPLVPKIRRLPPEDVVQQPPSNMEVGIIGFSKGWLITLEKDDIYLVNPFTSTADQVHPLPPVHTFPSVLEYRPHMVGQEYVIGFEEDNDIWFVEELPYFFHKVVLSSSMPNSKDFIAMAIYGEISELAFCKYGDKKWNFVDQTDGSGDAIFYQNKIYVVNCLGSVHVISDLDSTPKAVCVINPTIIFRHTPTGCQLIFMESYDGYLHLLARNVQFRDYIQETSKSLERGMLVARNLQWREDIENYYQTVNIEIFNVNLNSCCYMKLSSLDNQILFIGGNESISLPSRNFLGCKENHIYFCDKRRGLDVGVFHYNEMDLHPLPGYMHHSQFSRAFLPIWVMRRNP